MKVAVAQMQSLSDVEANLEQAARLIAQAADQGAQLVVLPENFAYFGRAELLSIAEQEQGGDGPISEFLKSQADRYGLGILAGTLPLLPQKRTKEDTKVFTCSTLWLPGEGVVAAYNKCHLFDVDVGDEQGRYCESDNYLAGSESVVYGWDDARIGLSVCYDLRFPEFYRLMVEQGANVFTVPSAFTYKTGRAHWEVLLRARAIENQAYVLAPNQGGDHGKGRRTWGHSMIVDPWGEVLACVEEPGPGLALAELNFEYLKSVRTKMPCLEHRKFTHGKGL